MTDSIKYNSSTGPAIGDYVLARYGNGEKLHHAEVADMVLDSRRKFAPAVPVLKVLCHHHQRNCRQSQVRIVFARPESVLEVTCETCLRLLEEKSVAP